MRIDENYKMSREKYKQITKGLEKGITKNYQKLEKAELQKKNIEWNFVWVGKSVRNGQLETIVVNAEKCIFS